MNASHPFSNSLRSSVPIAPKSSVIKSSIGVHPIAFNSSLLIILFSFPVFTSKIFIHNPFSSFYLSERCFLRFFLKTIKQYHQITLIHTTKNPINITALFNSNFKKSMYPNNCFKKFLRNLF